MSTLQHTEEKDYKLESYDATGIVRTLWIFKPFRRWYVNWIERVLPRVNEITLDRNKVFVFPTKEGLAFVACSLAVFVGGTNYGNNLILALGFLMFSIFMVTIWHSFLNLLGVTIIAGSANPIFYGEYAKFKITLRRPHNHFALALNLVWPYSIPQLINIEEDENKILEVQTKAPKRGRFIPPRLTIETRFPLGIIRCWSHVALDMSCIVYPKPLENNFYLGEGNEGFFGNKINLQSNEDFYELKKYQPGDNMSHVAWKSYSKGQGLMTKSYAGYLEEAVWLKWEDFSPADVELRLSYLCYWVLKCNREKRIFGLDIPGKTIQPSSGDNHCKACLTQLALFQV